MTSISSVPGQTINNQFNYQTHTGGSTNTQGTGSTDATSGLSGQKGAVPPIIAALENLIQDLAAAALAPASGKGTEKAEHHHHHSGSKTSTDSSTTTSGSTTSAGTNSSSPSEQLADAAKLIEQLWSSTDGTINQLAKIIIMEAADESQEAQQQAIADTDAAKANLLDQAQTLRNEASQMREGAAVALVMTVVSSAVTIGFVAGSMKLNSDSMGKLKGLDGKSATEQSLALQEAQGIGNTATSVGQIGQAISGLTSGLGTFANTMYQADEKDTEAEGDVAAAQAQDLNAHATTAQKIADDMNKLVDQIVDLIKEMADADVQMMQAMTRV